MVKVGKRTAFGVSCFLDGNIRIGEDCRFNRGVIVDSSLPGKIVIGNYVIVGEYVVFRNANHGYNRIDIPILEQQKVVEDIEIGNDVWICAHCTITAGARISDGCVITANSKVSGYIPPYSVAGGNPAMVLWQRGNNHVVGSHDGLFILKEGVKFKLQSEA